MNRRSGRRRTASSGSRRVARTGSTRWIAPPDNRNCPAASNCRLGLRSMIGSHTEIGSRSEIGSHTDPSRPGWNKERRRGARDRVPRCDLLRSRRHNLDSGSDRRSTGFHIRCTGTSSVSIPSRPSRVLPKNLRCKCHGQTRNQIRRPDNKDQGSNNHKPADPRYIPDCMPGRKPLPGWPVR